MIDLDRISDKFDCNLVQHLAVPIIGVARYVGGLIAHQERIKENEIGDNIELTPELSKVCKMEAQFEPSPKEELAILRMLESCLGFRYMNYCTQVTCRNFDEITVRINASNISTLST